eukprot:3307728-Alexandrium_andersonii.AAC.1
MRVGSWGSAKRFKLFTVRDCEHWMDLLAIPLAAPYYGPLELEGLDAALVGPPSSPVQETIGDLAWRHWRLEACPDIALYVDPPTIAFLAANKMWHALPWF